jgi:sigma-E factor negative regulatory protein RseB
MFSARWWSFAVLPVDPAAARWWTGSSAEAAVGAEPIDPVRWLARINAAARERNYQGTMVFTVGGAVSSSKVAHFCVGDQSFERLEALDGKMRKVFRHNETVHTVWPQAAVAVVEKRGALSNLPSNLQTVDPRALEQYELKSEGRERIAGRDAQVFLLQPRDEWRFAQRVWADEASGLMLQGRRASAPAAPCSSRLPFPKIEIGVKPPQPDSILQAVRKLDGFKVLRPQQTGTQLEAEGWILKAAGAGLPPGQLREAFCSIGSGRDLRRRPAIRRKSCRPMFSDGLTHVSLFIEPFDAARHRKDLSHADRRHPYA